MKTELTKNEKKQKTFTLKKLTIPGFKKRGLGSKAVVVACFVLAGIIGTALNVTSHAAAMPQWTGILEAYNYGSGWCLTTTGGGEGSYIQLEKCSGSYNANQVWSVIDTRTINIPGETSGYGTASGVQEFTLQSAAGSNECLNDWQASTSNGTLMRLYPCTSSAPASAWAWETKINNSSPHQIMNLAASKISLTGGRSKNSSGNWPYNSCLDVKGGTAKSGAQIDAWSCKLASQGPSNQEWIEQSAPAKSSGGGSGSLGNPGGFSGTTWSGSLQNGYDRKLCMNDNNSSKTNGTVIGIYNCENVVSEKWYITKNGNGQFYLQNGQGICADTGSIVPNDGTTYYLVTDTCNKSDLWTWSGHELLDVSTGGCINDPSSSTTNGTQLRVANCTNPGSEQWFEAGL